MERTRVSTGYIELFQRILYDAAIETGRNCISAFRNNRDSCLAFPPRHTYFSFLLLRSGNVAVKRLSVFV